MILFRNILTVLLAALALFIWSSVSWMALPLHKNSVHTFKNPAEVSDVLLANAPKSGVYQIPAQKKPDGSHVSEEDWQAAFDKGPFMQGLVRVHPVKTSMGRRLGGSFIVNVVAVALIVYVLFLGKVNSKEHRTLVAVGMGMFAVAVDWLPAMNWFDFPLAYILPYAVDALVGSLLAGLVVAFGLPRFYGPGAD
jgi:hypothetical protein